MLDKRYFWFKAYAESSATSWTAVHATYRKIHEVKACKFCSFLLDCDMSYSVPIIHLYASK